MSYTRTVSGQLWGSAKQQAAVQKAAEASAAKRRKRHIIDMNIDRHHQGKVAPTSAEVIADAVN